MALRPRDKWCSIKCKDNNRERNPKRVEQRKKNSAEWRSWNKQYRREYMLKYTYGITHEQYEELLDKQKRCCAICGDHESKFKRAMHVEHDHKTMEIQGIVCYKCNTHLLGRNRDPELFYKAAEYLKNSHTGWIVPPKKKKRKKRSRKKNKNGR